MDMITPLLPEAWQPRAKTIVAILGAVVGYASVAFTDLPPWATGALGLLTALGVYQVPNLDPASDPEPDPLAIAALLEQRAAELRAGPDA